MCDTMFHVRRLGPPWQAKAVGSGVLQLIHVAREAEADTIYAHRVVDVRALSKHFTATQIIRRRPTTNTYIVNVAAIAALLLMRRASLLRARAGNTDSDFWWHPREPHASM
jgi:hypothetical protein